MVADDEGQEITHFTATKILASQLFQHVSVPDEKHGILGFSMKNTLW